MLLGIIGDKIFEGVTYIFLIIDSFVYGLVNKIYKVYMTLAGARIFSSKMFTAISNRIYAVVGIVMLFVLAYTIIQGIISPDKFSKGSSNGAQIVRKVLIAVLGIALVPAAFNLAYRGQDAILQNDVIGKIFLGFDDESNVIKNGSISVDGEEIVEKGEVNQNEAIKKDAGTITAVSLWQAFFYPANTDDEESVKEAAKDIKAHEAPKLLQGAGIATKLACGFAIASVIFSGPIGILGAAALCGGAAVTEVAENVIGKSPSLEQAYSSAASSGDFSVFPAFAKNVVKGQVKYVMLLSTIVGIVCIYLFLSFSIDMAVRAVKLAFLELIAPIPLMMQIMPGREGSFKKWRDNCLSLFFEVFIRLAMVYVIVYLIAHLGTILSSTWATGIKNDWLANITLKVLLIFGLLIFAKEAPGFISKSLGIEANITGGFGIRNKLDKGGVFAFGAATGAIGANALSGFANRVARAGNKFKEDSNKTLRQRAGGALGTLASAPLYGIGQGLRSSRRAIIKSHDAHSLSSMKDQIQDSTAYTKEQIAKAQQKRDALKQEIKDKADIQEGDSLIKQMVKYGEGAAGTAAERMKKGLRDFASVPRDNTYVSEKAQIIAKEAALNDKLIESVANTDQVKNAQRHLEIASGNQRITDLVNQLAKERSKNGNVVTADDIRADAEAMAEVERRRNAGIKEAEEALKIAQQTAINDNLLSGTFGESNKTTEALRSFMEDNYSLFSKHAKDVMGNGKTLEENLKNMFGDNAFTGDVDFLKAANSSKGSFEFKIKGANDRETKITSKAIKNSSGEYERQFSYTDADGKVRTASSLEEAVKNAGITGATSISGIHRLGTADKGGSVRDDMKEALKALGRSGTQKITFKDGGTVEVGLDNAGDLVYTLNDGSGTIVTTDSDDDYKSFVSSREALVSDDYLSSLRSSVKDGIGYKDWELELEDPTGAIRSVRYDSSSDQYYLTDSSGTTTYSNLASLKSATSGYTVKSSTVYTKEEDSVGTQMKSRGKEDQVKLVQSAEYKDAIKAQQAKNGGDKK